MKIRDNTKAVEILMYGKNGVEISNDFFAAGNLLHEDSTDTFVVQNVNYCINQAVDWMNFEDEGSDEDQTETRDVDIREFNIWTVFKVAGDTDGETLEQFDTESEAIKFARDYSEKHEAEWGAFEGVAIADVFGNVVTDW